MRIKLACLVAALAVCNVGVRADTVTLNPSKDNTLYEDPNGALSNGVGGAIIAGRTAQGPGVDIRRALLAFDLTSIPAGSTITAADLTLNVTRTVSAETSVSLHMCMKPWGEGTSNSNGQDGAGAAAEHGDATWTYNDYPHTLWTTPGGDFEATPSCTKIVSGLRSYTWSGGLMISDVQNWVNGTKPNYGWVLVGDESTIATAKKYDSRESSNLSGRPKLTVTFTPPPISGACCLPAGGCIVATPAICAAQSGTYQGDGVTCAMGGCPGVPGACCVPAMGCSVVTQSDCLAMGGTFNGEGSMCDDVQCTAVLTPFLDALPLPAVAIPTTGTIGGVADYKITLTQFRQQLHSQLPPTLLWGYNGTYPGPTIETSSNNQVRVTYRSELRDDANQFLTTHALPVDMCIHGPNHLGPTPRTVVHVHGAHVEAASDGYPETTILPGQQQMFTYSNKQPATTLWYHDHALGITRLNVMMGLAGFWIVRSPQEAALNLPSGQFEVPLAIQDRMFNPDGSLQYPVNWMDHFFGDTMLVNGKVWPYFNVKQGKYRFRLLNGCNHRVLTLALSNGATFQQIGSDGGLLVAPVTISSLTIAPGERADVVMDFTTYAAGTEIILNNSAPAPFPGTPGVGLLPDVMKFIVQGQAGFTGAIPTVLTTIPRMQDNSAVVSRNFEIRPQPDPCTGVMWTINGLGWHNITEFPRLNSIEVWNFINRSSDLHPMHMHLVQYQVLDRQNFTTGAGGTIVPVGPRMAPAANELGWKDTVQAYPNQITRVISRFEDYTGLFAYHCHMLEHEDNEMMRQMQVMPACGTADFDGDGDSGTDADIEAFFACLSGNCCATCFGQDFDQDGDSGTDFDIEAFFRVLGGAAC